MRAMIGSAGWASWLQVLCLAGLVFGMTACNTPPSDRLNAPPQGNTDRPHEQQDNYVRMVDNNLLAERSMSPVHFVSSTAELNSLGVRRLKRYATILKVYGGPLHYDGVDEEEELAKHRVEQIKQFLVSAGVGPDHFTVDVAMADGRGIRPSEGSEVRKGLTPTNTTVQAAQVRIMTEDK
jgi:hypothetical protein